MLILIDLSVATVRAGDVDINAVANGNCKCKYRSPLSLSTLGCSLTMRMNTGDACFVVASLIPYKIKWSYLILTVPMSFNQALL